MGLICLLGRHGSGKSAIGAELALRGYHHTSVGMLRRLARNGQFPIDVPAALITAMRRERPGSVLSEPTARKLVSHVVSHPFAVLDGFPSGVDHLALLPDDTIYCLVWTSSTLRALRLDQRSATSARIWTPGQASARESSLPSLITSIRQARRCLFIRNNSTVVAAADTLLNRLFEVGLR